ncbi:MAG: UDP-N-acetylmuramoyl-L-alanyl-D-glutamate--2,6-diaminopimelate ligase [Nitriliruptoraceae bacterium]
MPITLRALLVGIADALCVGTPLSPGDDGPMLFDAAHDSRAAGPGVLFCALPGARTDGHDHAAAAVAAGSPALLVERPLALDVPQVIVPSTRHALGPVASLVHGDPSAGCRVIGVTGTNGKTTTVALVEAAVAAAGLGSGVIGTTGARVHGAVVPNERTTPEATDLQRLLRSFVDRGVEVAAIEVSSHGLQLRRIDGTQMAVAGFTMLGEDHLDFHGDVASYLAAKQRLFTPALTARAVVVVDDVAGRTVAAASQVPTVTVSTGGGDADHRLVEVEVGLEGGRGVLVGPDGAATTLRTRLLGRHNLSNAALAFVLATEAGVDAAAAAAGIAACDGVPGRLERVEVDGRVALVDYAHTPDAIRIVVAELRRLLPVGGRLAVVVGAGGDRDTTKRAPMGAAAAAADLAVITSDNPRSEDPRAIVSAVADGADTAVLAGAPATVLRELDRRRAIAAAVAWAGPLDVILVAGKGHELGQTFADRTDPFDDREVARALLSEGEA